MTSSSSPFLPLPFMKTTLMSLPSEVIASILAYLPISSLFAFSATSRTNQALAEANLQHLKLAVFNNRVHGALAFASHYSETDQIGYNISQSTDMSLTSTSNSANPASVIRHANLAQNALANDILSKRAVQDLRSLSLYMFDLQSPVLASTIATKLPKLRELELIFCHPYIHDGVLPSNYWREAPDGNQCWNALAGLGQEYQKQLRLRNLQTLKVERAGITSAQLRKFVQSNLGLRVLHLSNITGVDEEFVHWLAEHCENEDCQLEKVVLELCPSLKMRRYEDFAWLAGMSDSSVKHLSLSGCRHVRQDILTNLLDDEDEEEFRLDGFETFIPPNGPIRHYGLAEGFDSAVKSVTEQTGFGSAEEQLSKGHSIEVDPEFLPSIATAT